MHKVSLILSTLGERPDDLCAFLRSVVPQAAFISEIIVVDQNPDHELLPRLLLQFEDLLPIRHTRTVRGLSRARNHGLSMVTGSIVAFPDDDCLYSEGLLEWITNWFESNVEYDILAVGVKDASGAPSGNRWPQDACVIRALNAFRTTFSSSLFIVTGLARTARFDLQLGVGAGTPYGSGEETDYVLRLLHKRARGRFDRRTRYVIHPRRDMLSGPRRFPAPRLTALDGSRAAYALAARSVDELMAYNLTRAGICLCLGAASSGALPGADQGIVAGFLAPKHARAADVAPPHVMKPRDGSSAGGIGTARVFSSARCQGPGALTKPMATTSYAESALARSVPHQEHDREIPIWEQAFTWLLMAPVLFICLSGWITTDTTPIAFRFSAMEDQSVGRRLSD